ncbi:MAG: hypothetical protein IPP15_15955 [Saprospiraceae bacterium]|uniref:Uncharacterized protein n=1 Tax=Candidatus Opimibacter skivensis TaxID=2982028 RepID=A0A9D7SX42_9BACT|nr:hypothetical protein [Candidatus Opimibacter skivensis]
MYTFLVDRISYSTVTEHLAIDSFIIRPNYKEYDLLRLKNTRSIALRVHLFITMFMDLCVDDFIKYGDIVFREAIVQSRYGYFQGQA